MGKVIFRGQKGFTLVELLAVMAILGILAALVAGSIVGLGTRGQSTRLDGDRDSIRKAATRFATEAFPEVFPVISLDDTDSFLKPDTDLGVRIIDFKALLPQDTTKKFVPDYLNELPDSSALVSWRIDTNSGAVFFGNSGSLLIKPSNNRLDIETDSREPEEASNHTLELNMTKGEAALEILNVQVPAGYSIAGRFDTTGTLLGVLSVTLATDNEVDPGNTIRFGGVLVSTDTANEFDLVVDYNDSISKSGKGTAGELATTLEFKPTDEAVRVHTVTLTPPAGDSGGELTLEMDRGSDDPQNTATEFWELTIFGEAELDVSGVFDTTDGIDELARTLDVDEGFSVNEDDSTSSTADAITAERLITNPSTSAVYRWLADEHTTISPVVGDTKFFSDVPGSQGVLIKTGLASATATPEPTAVPNSAPVATAGSETVTAGSTTTITLTGTDADDDTLSFIISALSSGALVDGSTTITSGDLPFFLAGATVDYTAGSTGSDVFSFRVSDGQEFSSAADIDITIN